MTPLRFRILCLACLSGIGVAFVGCSAARTMPTNTELPPMVLVADVPEFREPDVVANFLLEAHAPLVATRYQVKDIVIRNASPSVNGPLNEVRCNAVDLRDRLPEIIIKFPPWWSGALYMRDNAGLIIFLDSQYKHVLGVTRYVAEKPPPQPRDENILGPRGLNGSDNNRR